MSLLSKLVPYARSWGVDPSGIRFPSRRALGLVAALSAVPLLSACPTPNGNGVTPPPGSPVSIAAPASLNSGVLDVAYRVDRDFDRCRLRLHGVTVAVDENVSAGDHVISFPRLRPNQTYPVDMLCSDADGFTHSRGQIVEGAYRFSMDTFRSRTVNVRVGDLESCTFDPVQSFAASKGNLPASAFAPLDSGCYWNPEVDAARPQIEFVTPEEVELIDWLSSDAKPQGMSDHTIGTLLSRTAGLETLLSRQLVRWELDPRVWEDEVAFAQRGWRLYRENVSRGWQDGSFDLDYRILGLKNEFWPAEYNLPGTITDPSITGIPINPGSIGMSFLNLADDYVTSSETWLSRLGFGACATAAEMKEVFSHDQGIEPDFARNDARFPNGIPYTWMLPTEALIVSLDKTYLDPVGNNDFDVAVLVQDHSRDLYKGAPAGFVFRHTHIVPADLNGDGIFDYDDTGLSAGMFVSGYTGTRDGGQLLFTNPDHLFQIDYTIVGPHLGRLEARTYAYGASVPVTDPDDPFFTFGLPQRGLGMIDAEMIETGSGFVGLGQVDSKYARISGTSGTGLLIDLSIYGSTMSAPGVAPCEPYALVFVDPE